jgi:hypothetical protein
LRDRLAQQLSILQLQGLVVTWYDRQIPAGDEWDMVKFLDRVSFFF